jgi:SpoIIAA-like
MQDLPDDVIGISVFGVITARDYTDVIVPLVQQKLKAHGTIKLLYRIGPEFEAFTAGAVWSDARVGIMHLTDFSKIAVVSDLGWIRHAVRAFAPLIPGHVHVFADRELDEAKAWVTA